MEQRLSSESNSSTTSQESSSLYGIRRFMTAFTEACHFPYPEPDQTSPCPHRTYWRLILILFSHLYLGLTSGITSSGFHHQNRICTSLHQYSATTPAHLFLFWSPAKYLVMGTGHKVHGYALFFTPALHSPSYLYV